MNLTEEQQKIVNTLLSTESDNKIVTIDSVAGSGKTSTAVAIVEALKPKKGFYTAFNKAIIEESRDKLPSYMEVKTIHALAYKYVKNKEKIEDFTYTSISESLTYPEKAEIINLLDEFYRSNSVNIFDFMEEYASSELIADIAIKYANLMLAGSIPITFNFMLKCLHLLLVNKDITLEYDLLILDECQDTTAVTLEIFKNITAKKRVMLGDIHQNIYSFMNTVNGFNLLENDIRLRLTKSFRCSKNIAEKVEAFGKRFLNEDFTFKGNEDIKDNAEIKTKAFISRTNATLVVRMNEMHNMNKTYSLTRSLSEIFALPLALATVATGKKLYDTRFKFLEIEYDIYLKEHKEMFSSFMSYINFKTKDPQVESASAVLLSFAAKGINIFDVLKKAKNIRPNPNVILTTAHAYKGLESDYVYIEEDLNNAVKKSLEATENDKEAMENLNTYYVAVSRAKISLVNAKYCEI